MITVLSTGNVFDSKNEPSAVPILCSRAGGVGLPALPVEDPAGGSRYRVHRRPPATAALLAARVGRQVHVHMHVAEARTHTAAQDHSKET